MDKSIDVDYVWGHGMFIRTKALVKTGSFDPELFMYYEDIDLCIRMKKGGYEIWYDPTSIMWHDIQDGARAKTPERWRWQHKSTSIRMLHQRYYGLVNSSGRYITFIEIPSFSCCILPFLHIYQPLY